jgi:hypothetical protein
VSRALLGDAETTGEDLATLTEDAPVSAGVGDELPG